MDDSEFTVARALSWATERLRAASDTPRLDAELLIAHALGWGRARVLAEGRQPLTGAQQALLLALVARRANQEPIAYITGHKEFYGLDLLVDRRVLTPRPETELLVDLAIERARRMASDEPRAAPIVIADIGTGSGAIAIALAAHLSDALIYAVDSSADALEVARQNAARHGLDRRVRFVAGDLLGPLAEPADLIVSNPPYTILAEISPGVRRHEPRLALDGGPDGLAVYRRLLAQAPAKLRPGGAVLLEVGATQATAVADLARAWFPAARITAHRDLAGWERVVAIESPGNAKRPT